MIRVIALLGIAIIWSVALDAAPLPPPYMINPGDVLTISVWKEPDLQLEALVRPDGGFSMPLIGEVVAAGKPALEVRNDIAKRINTFVPDAVVTVEVHQLTGNKIYVLGKVNHPGEFEINRYVDVMQALSMAGGNTTFAGLKKITILRRDSESQGGEKAIEFNYDQVSDGKHLEQNIILQSGDVVVVP